jgi:hypothetical protein
MNQPVKVDKWLANALLLIAPHSDLVDMTRVNPTIHQTIWQVLQEVLKSSGAPIASLRLSYQALILLSKKQMWTHLPY